MSGRAVRWVVVGVLVLVSVYLWLVYSVFAVITTFLAVVLVAEGLFGWLHDRIVSRQQGAPRPAKVPEMYSGVALAFGYVVVLGAVVLLINWRFYEEGAQYSLGEVIAPEEVEEVSPITKPPPPPPPPQVVKVQEVEEPQEEEQPQIEETEATEKTAVDFIPPPPPPPPKPQPEKIFFSYELDQQEFQRYKERIDAELDRHIRSMFTPPEECFRFGTGSRAMIVVRFVIWKDGRIDSVGVVRSSGCPYADEEAVRVISAKRQLEPASHMGKPISVWFTKPIIITLK